MTGLPAKVPLLSVGITRCALCHYVIPAGAGYELRELILNDLLVYAATHHEGECEVRDVIGNQWLPRGLPA